MNTNSLTSNSAILPEAADKFILIPQSQSQQCKDIELALLNPPYSIVFHFHLILLLVTLIAIGILIRQYFLHKIKMHGNLSVKLQEII